MKRLKVEVPKRADTVIGVAASRSAFGAMPPVVWNGDATSAVCSTISVSSGFMAPGTKPRWPPASVMRARALPRFRFSLKLPPFTIGATHVPMLMTEPADTGGMMLLYSYEITGSASVVGMVPIPCIEKVCVGTPKSLKSNDQSASAPATKCALPCA